MVIGKEMAENNSECQKNSTNNDVGAVEYIYSWIPIVGFCLAGLAGVLASVAYWADHHDNYDMWS